MADRPSTAAPPSRVVLFDLNNRHAIEEYLQVRGFLTPGERPARIERAGAGNMNLTLRVTTLRRSLIVKQGRPWVEKYPEIAAPWNRTSIEGRFYWATQSQPTVARGLPTLLYADQRSHVLILEDLGKGSDCSSVYATGDVAAGTIEALLHWLDELSTVLVAESERPRFANRAMRALNYEHLFRVPFDEHNSLDLDRITPGLASVARAIQRDAGCRRRVDALGECYLADGRTLVHGDYFPGSWLTPGRANPPSRRRERVSDIYIIDPEFCFLGAPEFDYGVMLGHLALARCKREFGESVLASATAAQLDVALVTGFAGVEIMRRLIGVAQLPLPYGLDVKRGLLALSADLVRSAERPFDRWSC